MTRVLLRVWTRTSPLCSQTKLFHYKLGFEWSVEWHLMHSWWSWTTLKSLNVCKSFGPDYIPARILKKFVSHLTLSLGKLLNKSFSAGLLRQDWKLANIVPMHKKNSKCKRENYQQASLKSVISKIVEKIFEDRLVEFVEKYLIKINWDISTTSPLYPNCCYATMTGQRLYKRYKSNPRCFMNALPEIHACSNLSPLSKHATIFSEIHEVFI